MAGSAIMRLHEYQAQHILKEYGVPIPRGKVAFSVEQVRQIAERLGKRVVLKAQVLTGGRGRAGGIRLADGAAEAERLAAHMFGMDIQGYVVSKILVDEAIAIEREIYLSVAIDRRTAQPVLLASAEGGSAFARVARDTPERVHRMPIDPLLGLRAYQVHELAYRIGLNRQQIPAFTAIALRLYQAFVDNDALVAEINPLVIAEENVRAEENARYAEGNGEPGGEVRMVSLDARMIIDDDALFRHCTLSEMRDEGQETWAEQLARRHSIDYVKLSGQVGCLANGAGLAMATMDLLRMYDVRPASFVDFGGGAGAERVKVALRLALANQPQALLINVFGGVTRCDEVARGILSARETLSSTVPMAVRLAGRNAPAGQALLARSGFYLADSSLQAVRWIASLVNGGGQPEEEDSTQRRRDGEGRREGAGVRADEHPGRP